MTSPGGGRHDVGARRAPCGDVTLWASSVAPGPSLSVRVGAAQVTRLASFEEEIASELSDPRSAVESS